LVDGTKGIHGMIPKAIYTRQFAALIGRFTKNRAAA